MKSTATILAHASNESIQIVQLIPASQLTRYPTNRVPTEEAVKAMTASIRENGVIQPILARPLPEANALQLIFGETRWKACHAIDPNYPVPCRVRPLDDREAARIHAIENFQREGLTPTQEAREIRHMMDVGWNLDEVMEHLTRSKDWCYRRLAVLKLPEEGQAAVDAGHLAVEVAEKIATLPEALRADAVRNCITPTHSSEPLVKREALAMLHKKFIEPLKAAEEWNAKKKLLLRENPGAVFLEYKDACAAHSYASEYEPAEEIPSYHLLSEAAQQDEIPIPTWKALAEKHGAPIYIGRDYTGNTTLYVHPEPIIEAEKTAYHDKPGDCIFAMEQKSEDLRTANERRKLEAERAAAERAAAEFALLTELIQIGQSILKGAPNKTITRALAAYAYDSFAENLYQTQWPEILGVKTTEDEPETDHHERTLDLLRKQLLRSDNPFELLGRIHLITQITDYGDAYYAITRIGDTGIIKPTTTPALHALLENRRAEQSEIQETIEQQDQDEAA